jgi:hypothetical protein
MHTRSRHLAELRDEAAELERRLSDARRSLERELAQTVQPGSGWAPPAPGHPPAGPAPAGPGPQAGGYPPAEDAATWGQAGDDGAAHHRAGHDQPAHGLAFHGPAAAATGYSTAGYPSGCGAGAEEPDGYGPPAGYPPGYPPAAEGPDRYGPPAGESPGCRSGSSGHGDVLADERTEVLVSHGRSTAASRRLPRRHAVAIGGAAAAAAAVLCVALLPHGSPPWPASVATVQREIAVACRNPDVKSEPSQVNFACNEGTRQVLWVFSLLTSGNNPRYRDPRTGRVGLEPISPAQGGQIAWSLNLHHPYNPSSPIDSLQVAARAINNIIGGATVTGPGGKPEIQPGLESDPENCLRYTGSAAVIARKGFPARCARPLVTPEGQAALVADVYQRWILGAPAKAAQDAAVLFMNSGDPGSPQVQAILRHLPAGGG